MLGVRKGRWWTMCRPACRAAERPIVVTTTAYFSHPDCLAHDMGPGHPECPERLDAINDRLHASGLMDALAWHEPPLATTEQMALAHTQTHLENLLLHHTRLAAAAGQDRGALSYLDPDTAMNPRTWDAVRRAAGAALAATDAVIQGEAENAFCAVRPPGHHACHDRAMGFCLVNNVALAAKYALEHHGLERVAIVDFDVHHGNGTEDIVAGDTRILMVGFYQHPFYPHGGSNSGAANVLNLPVAAYTKGQAIRALIEARWLPRLDTFSPQMLFVSAGFDAHREDDLGQLGLVEDDYRWITRQIKAIAHRHASGRIVSCLEGGYNLDALGRSVEVHVRELAGLS